MPPTQGQLDRARARAAGTPAELALALQRSRQLEQQVSEAQANLDNSISANEALADEQVALQQQVGELQALVAQLQGGRAQERAAGGAETQARCAELEVRRDDGLMLRALFSRSNTGHQTAADPSPLMPTQGELDRARAQVASAQEEAALVLQRSRQRGRQLAEQVRAEARERASRANVRRRAVITWLRARLEQELAGGAAMRERCAELKVGLPADDDACMMLRARCCVHGLHEVFAWTNGSGHQAGC
jgi:hypothetical protein